MAKVRYKKKGLKAGWTGREKHKGEWTDVPSGGVSRLGTGGEVEVKQPVGAIPAEAQKPLEGLKKPGVGERVGGKIKEALIGTPEVGGKPLQMGYAPPIGGLPTGWTAVGEVLGKGRIVSDVIKTGGGVLAAGKDFETIGEAVKKVGPAGQVIGKIGKGGTIISTGKGMGGIGLGGKALIGGGAVWLANQVAEGNLNLVWASVDNIATGTAFSANKVKDAFRAGAISPDEAVRQMSDLKETVTYAESYVKLSVTLNPYLWFGLGKPYLVACKKAQDDLDRDIDMVKTLTGM